jgi:G3E family GTPase
LPSPALAACAPDYALGYGLGSFLFQRWRPVREAALRGFFERGWPGLLRVKGFVWTAEEP